MDIDQKTMLEISVSVYSAFGKENRAGIPDNSAQWLGTLPFNELHSSPLSPQSTLFRDALGQVHPTESRLPTPSAIRIVGSASALALVTQAEKAALESR